MMNDSQRLAMIAAEAATIAAAGLLRFAREGEEGKRPFGLDDPMEQLAEALVKTITIEQPYLAKLELADEESEAAGQLLSAIVKWQADVGAF